jgi:hypothetical protein
MPVLWLYERMFLGIFSYFYWGGADVECTGFRGF